MSNQPEARSQRRIRSFVRREGRMTDAQRTALQRHWQRFGVEPGSGPLDTADVFGRAAPLHLEIGFGMGDSLLHMALQAPENNYLGIEVYRPGVGHLLRRLDECGVENVRLICADAVEVLEHNIPPGSLAALYLFFPDPWPKKRHHKRRIVQPGWIELVRARLKPAGILHMATDWEPYAEWMRELMQQAEGWINLGNADGYASRPAYRPETKFERRGKRLGHGVRDLIYARSAE
ncbi:MAG: tRNA (guanosine(46)-N7)-methyltransferase TrmB [Gammaproteobacteria bacterium]